MYFSSVFALSLFSFIVLLPHRSLCCFFAAVDSFFFFAAAVLVFFTFASHTQWNVTVNMSEFLSAPSFTS